MADENTTTSQPSVVDIIKQGAVVSRFQPLVSIKTKAVLGVEALSRGRALGEQHPVDPGTLFRQARREDCVLELDRLCREKALDAFVPLHKRHRDLILTLNMNAQVLDLLSPGSNHLFRQVESRGIDPNNILIEIIESDVKNLDALLAFTELYRKYGFLIALDDVGTGHSNLERVALIKPEVIKIDRSLISDIDREFYKREVAKSLIGLSQRIGAMVVGEGVEREEEVVTLLEMGVDVFQGFFFARPGPPDDDSWGEIGEKMDAVARRFRRGVVNRINRHRRQMELYNGLLASVVRALERADVSTYDRVLAEQMALHADMECLYVLDRAGMQVSGTVCNPFMVSVNKRFIYRPAQRDADHSLKDYFLPIKAGLPKYTTDTYISLASGNLCITIACRFTAKGGEKRIVCLDIAHRPD